MNEEWKLFVCINWTLFRTFYWGYREMSHLNNGISQKTLMLGIVIGMSIMCEVITIGTFILFITFTSVLYLGCSLSPF